MTGALVRLSAGIDRINHGFARLAGWLCVVLVLLTVEQVIARYFFAASSVALQELECNMFGMLFLLAAAHTLKQDGHVRVDIFYSKFGHKAKALVNILGTLFTLMPVCVIVVLHGVDQMLETFNYVNPRPPDFYSAAWLGREHALYNSISGIEGFIRSTFLRGEVSSDPGGLEGLWFIKGMIPFGFALLGLQGLSEVIKFAGVLHGRTRTEVGE